MKRGSCANTAMSMYGYTDVVSSVLGGGCWLLKVACIKF